MAECRLQLPDLQLTSDTPRRGARARLPEGGRALGVPPAESKLLSTPSSEGITSGHPVGGLPHRAVTPHAPVTEQLANQLSRLYDLLP